MKDITMLKRMLLEEYTSTNSTKGEVDAFVRGMNWLEDELASATGMEERLQDSIPERVLLQSAQMRIHSLEEKLEQTTLQLNRKKQRVEELEGRLQEFMTLSLKDKRFLRRENGYQELAKENERLKRQRDMLLATTLTAATAKPIQK